MSLGEVILRGFIPPKSAAKSRSSWRARDGHVRVCTGISTRDQDLAAVAELAAAGCAKVYREKASGAKGDRPELAKVIAKLECGDVLVVTRLDRLARSTRDLLNVIAAITERGAGFNISPSGMLGRTRPAPTVA